MSPEQIALSVIVLLLAALMVTSRVRPDLVALLTLTALALSGLVTP